MRPQGVGLAAFRNIMLGFLLTTVFGSALSATAGTLALSIKPKSPVVVIGDKVWLLLEVTNNSNESIRVVFESRIPQGLRFSTRRGKQLRFIEDEFRPSIEESSVTVEPGKAAVFDVDFGKFATLEGTGEYEIAYEARLKYFRKIGEDERLDNAIATGVFRITVVPTR